MCFSAGASFGASVVLCSIGVAAIAKAKTNPQRLFASIPLIFSLQQLIEGFLWLSINDSGLSNLQSFFTYIFLLFAMIVWPLWIPLTIRLLEKDAKRKKTLNIMTVSGAVVSLVVLCVLILYPVQVMPMHHHLHYRFDFPEGVKNLIDIFTILYFITTVVPPFFSSTSKMKLLGTGFMLSYIIAILFYKGFVVSVWCYFAAILSIVVLWIIMDLRKLSFKEKEFLNKNVHTHSL